MRKNKGYHFGQRRRRGRNIVGLAIGVPVGIRKGGFGFPVVTIDAGAQLRDDMPK